MYSVDENNRIIFKDTAFGKQHFQARWWGKKTQIIDRNELHEQNGALHQGPSLRPVKDQNPRFV